MIKFGLILGFLPLAFPAFCQAGEGRQTIEVEADYSIESVAKWVARNADQIEESTGSEIVEKVGKRIKLLRDTKYGPRKFTVQRSFQNGIFDVQMVSHEQGSLSDYHCAIELKPLSKHRTKITVTMQGIDHEHNGVEINIELRKSLRGMRTFLQGYLCRPH